MRMKAEWARDWGLEKCNKALILLAETIDILKKDDVSLEYISDRISGAIAKLTKLLAYFSDKEWDPNDPERIYERGCEGYEEIAVLYGLIEETSYSKNTHQYINNSQKSIKKLRECLTGPRSPCRTFINSILDEVNFKNQWTLRLEKITDEVNMGNLDWDKFVMDFGKILDEWENEIAEKEEELKSKNDTLQKRQNEF